MRAFLSFLCCLVLLHTPLAFSAASAGTILFVLYDAGETRAFEQVMKVLDKRHVPYSIIAFGTASKLLKHNKNVVDIRQKCQFKTNIHPKHWEPSQRVAESDIKKLTSCFKPNALVLGMSSMAQAQIGQAFSKSNTKVIAFYDRFQSAANNPVIQAVAQYADTVIVPAEDIAKDFSELGKNTQIKVLGHPSMEVWRKEIPYTDKDAVRESLGLIGNNKSIVLYIGGYGDFYDQSFEIFVKSLPFMRDKEILISIHPKVDGSTERAILAMHHASNYRFIEPGTSKQVAAIADFVVCQRSTAAVQAYFANIPVIYLNANFESKNILTEKGAVMQVSSREEFLKALAQPLTKEQTPEEITKLTGIPLNSAKMIAAEIMSAVPDLKLRENHHGM